MKRADDDITVLHVDDDEAVLSTTADFLEREIGSVEVVTATDAEHGIGILDERPVDCVVSDYEMPGTDGVEFLQAVRERDQDLPFILFTGKGSETIASEAISAGVTDYLQKRTDPSQYTVLANRITNAVERYRSERALEETERKLSQIAERTDDVLFMFDADWSELLFVNSAYEEIWGASIEEVEDDPRAFLEYIHPDDRDHVLEKMEELSAGSEATAEYRVLRAEEDVRYVRADSRPIIGDDGEVERIVGYVRDITDLRERETELERQNDQLERYQEIVETFDDIAVVADGDRRVTYANERLFDYFDLEEDMVVGQEVDALADVYVGGQEDRERLREAIDRAFATTPGEPEPIRLELPLDTDRGTRTFEVQISPIADGDGVVALVGLLRDVTERVERERALEETTERLEAVIDASPDAIMVVDDEGRITMWNPASERIFGWTEDEVLGEPNPVIPEDRREEFEDHKERAFSGEPVAGKETKRVSKSGELLDVSLSTAPVRDADGEIIGGMAVIEDITDRKRHERRLEAIVENTINPIYFKNASGVYRFVNQAAADVWGLDPEDVVGRTDDQLFEAESAARLRELDREVMETGEGVTQEMPVMIDGEEAVFLDNKFPFRDDEGEIIGTMGVTHEITERKQRERRLSRYERIVDNLPVGIYRTDDDGTILDVNRAAAAIAGIDDPELLRGENIDQFYPESQPRDHLIERLREEGAVEGVEVEAVTAEGERIWVEVTSRSVEEDGEVYYDGIVRDVTARKQREHELERHERIVNNLPVGVYRTDAVGNIVDGNQASFDVIDAESLEEAKQHNVLDLYADEEDEQRITEALLEDGMVRAEEMEVRTLTVDRKWVEITTTEVREDGEVYYDGIIRDITERKERERELERTRELLSQAQGIAEVGGWSFDMRGDPPHRPDWTDKMYDIMGVPRTEDPPPLDDLLDRYQDEDREHRDRIVEDALERREGWDIEARVEAFDGEQKWVRVIADPTYEDGELTHVRGSFQDVTERKEREREIERQNERLEAFAEVVSHDLRNPLNVAQGRLDLALRGDDHDGGEHLEAVADAHDRIEVLIEEMLALARQGDEGMVVTGLDLASVAEDAWESVPTEDASIEIAASSTIMGDRDQLQRLLENLFRNAVTHGGDGVTVRVDDADGGFVVEDDGEGFQEETDGLLEPGETTEAGGTGFGLAIVQRVAERHGWDVALGASGDGGARVTVTGVDPA